MTTSIVGGPRKWGGSRDDDGYRTWNITFRVEGDVTDGPANALRTSGLPVPGSSWNWLSDVDTYSYCKLGVQIQQVVEEGEPNQFWDLTFTFTNKNDPKKCKDQQIDDPLAQPPKVSGESVKYTEEAVVDQYGLPIVNSAFEQIRGPQVEFDKNRSSLSIEMNVASITTVNLAEAMVDHVNSATLWGNPPRCVKLSSRSFSKMYYGTCSYYYTLKLMFDINPQTFDRLVLDEGQKVLNGHWNPVTGAYVVDQIGGLVRPFTPTLTYVPSAGALAASTYGYRISAYNASGGETLASPETTITTPAGSGAVTISWSAVAGAFAYHVYGRTPSGEQLMGGSFNTNFTDNGTISPGGALPASDTSGGQIPNHLNPQHFVAFKDRNGENGRVILNGAGLPADVGVTQSPTGTGTFQGPGNILIQKYPTANFLLLGIPSSY